MHKAQGAEYPVVVLPLVKDHFPMLRRAFLYTAVSRAKRLLVLVGSSELLAEAVRRPLAQKRRTAISSRIISEERADGVSRCRRTSSRTTPRPYCPLHSVKPANATSVVCPADTWRSSVALLTYLIASFGALIRAFRFSKNPHPFGFLAEARSLRAGEALTVVSAAPRALWVPCFVPKPLHVAAQR